MLNASTSSKFRRKRNDPGRRPTRIQQQTNNVVPEERLYEIRGIKAEKWQGNTLLYLIDWADDRVTGEAYENTWEPADNVTEAAIEDWEKEKARRQALERHSQRSSVESTSESDSQPARRRKKRHRSIASGSDRGRFSKRARTSRGRDSPELIGDLAEEDWSLAGPLPDNKGEIVLEIRVDPGFDPREYIAISLSQSSQASQSISLSTSSVPRPAESVSEPRAKGKISQTTIPDSQEIPDSLPSQFTEEPPGVEASQVSEEDIVTELEPAPIGDETRVIQREPVSSGVSGLDIPSRQPDNSLPRHTQLSAGPLEVPDETSSIDPQNLSLNAFQPRTSSGFLTQPEFNLAPFLKTKSLPAAGGVDPDSVQESHEHHPSDQFGRASQDIQSSHGPTIDLPSNSQAAQVVAPLSSYPPKQLHTQTQDIIASIESDVVPDTVLKPAPRLSVAQSASAASGERDSSGEPEEDVFFFLHSPERSHLAMSFDDTPNFADRLRRMRDSVFDEPLFAPSRPSSLTPSAAQPQEQSIISPSSVLPGMGNEMQGIGPQTQGNSSDSTPSNQCASLSAGQELGSDLGITFPPDNSGHNTAVPPSHFETAQEQQSAFEQIPATVAPSDLTNSTPGLLTLTGDGLHGLDGHIDSLLPVPESDHYHPDADSDHHHERPQGEYTITLPMAANMRSEYLSRISGENAKTMVNFGKVFAESLDAVPSDELLAKMDRIFQQLLDLCDLPAWVHDVTALNPDAMWKHATGTNSKFSFVFEFLSDIRDLNTRVLILCRPGYTFQYLEALLSAPGFNYSILGQDSAKQDREGLVVMLASAEQDLSTAQESFDIVISFDHVSRTVDLSQVSSPAVNPLVLFLVVTHSIEHIDLQLGSELSGIERKAALNLAIGTARELELLKSPESSSEPHEIAKRFARYVRNPEIDMIWEPSHVPDQVLDCWLSSQANTQDQMLSRQGTIDLLNSRKRRLDEDEVGTPKRARILESSRLTPNETPAQMSDLLKSTLSKFPSGNSSSQVVTLPVSQLESMAAEISTLQSRLAAQSTIEGQYRDLITSLEAQVQSWEKSFRAAQPKFYQANRDRGIMAKENEAIKKKLEQRDLEIAKLKEQNQALQAKLDTPELEHARSTAAEEELEKARAKIQSLEKRIKSTEENMDYLREQYQTATSEAGKFENERRELHSRITELEKKAGDNFMEIQRKNREMAGQEHLRQMTEKNKRIQDQEREIDRLREDMKHLKNGRRETRQGSVPRSPRPGAVGGSIMSPRPPRGVGAGQLSGGPGSRGTSPAPVTGNFYNSNNNSDGYSSSASAAAPSMTLFSQPTGNGGRWEHLRD
ncbi:citron Rho-interacting kinase [Naviculisporaceae sp. PSN 640]